MKRKNLHYFKNVLLLLVSSMLSGSLYAQTYCTTLLNSQGGGTPGIDLVEIVTTALSNSTPGISASPYYTAYPASGATTADLAQGVTYSLNTTYSNGAAIGSVWFDWDQNGTFDASEWTQLTTNGTTGNITFTVPATAVLGQTGMRIRTRSAGSPNGAPDACTQFFSGETEDYIVTIIGGSGCSGAPTAGTAISSVSSVCSGQNISLSVTGATSGVTGLTYQWQSSPAGAGSFADITGATNATYTATQTSATDYQLIITCGNPGGGTATSTIVSVAQNGFQSCYCASGATQTGDEEIYNFTLNGVSSNTFSGSTVPCTDVAPGPGTVLNRYSNFTTLGPLTSLTQGQIYSFELQEDECPVNASYYAFGTAIWIDWNQDGIYSDVTEKVFVENTTLIGPRNVLGDILVPINAVPGQTGMRVTIVEGGSGTGLTACMSYGYGETEDYIVEIIQTVGCAGTPSAGIISASQATVCTGQAFTLASSGYTSASGITFQWYEGPSGSGSFTPIANATDPIYNVASQSAATDYYLEVSCTSPGGGTVVSNTITVGQNSFLACYCASGATATAYDDITDVTVNAISNPSTCTTTGDPATSIQGQYSDYTTVLAPISMEQGTTVPFSVTVGGACNFGSLYYGLAIFLDLDQDGLFSTSERVYASPGTTNAPFTSTGSFILPLNAVVGTTRMRVTAAYYVNNGSEITGCYSYYAGETEDYFVDITAAPICAGTPNGGTVSSSQSSVCANQPFTISAAVGTYSTGQGITYQWYENNGGGATPISGATSPFYTVTAGITVATDYYFEVSCTNPGGGVTVSNTITVGINPPTQCYCASGATQTGDEEIYSVTFNGVNSNTFTGQNAPCTDLAPGAGSIINKYANYQSLGSMTTVTQGQSYAFTVAEDECPQSNYYAFGTAIWIDWNQDGVFDNVTEKAFVENSTLIGPRNVTGNILVPITALPGQTGMRVTVSEGNAGANLTSCLSYGYGETEDYLIDVVAAVGCAGAPTAGTISSSQASVCVNQPYTLSATGYTAASGITFQWYANTGGGAVAISGATDPFYTVASQTSATDYYLDVTCTNPGGSTATSNTITVNQNGFMDCYCASGATQAGDEEIYSVTFNGVNSNTFTGQNAPCTDLAPGAGSVVNRYANYRTLGSITTVQQGQSVAFTVAEDECPQSNYYAFGTAIWVDWNQDGVFDDVTEKAFVENTTLTGPRNVIGSILVPVTALTGQTAMRITVAEGYSGTGLQACFSYGYGETEDYLIDVIAAVPCAGAPTAGTASASATSVCANQPFTLSATGYTIAGGITFQWYANTGGGATAISGATNPSYTVTSQTAATDYYLDVTCTNPGGSTATSNTVSVGQNSFFACYCVNGLGGGSSNSIENITIPSTTLNNSTPGTAVGMYTAYPATGTTTADLSLGSTYTLQATFNVASMGAVWFDWDQSGTFDASEWTELTTNASSASVSITVPSNAVLGQTGMRIRSRATGNTNGPTDACTLFGSGETEDYIISIIPGSSCLPPVASATNISDVSAELSWTAIPGAVGYEYVVDQTSASPASGTATTATTTTPNPYTGLTPTTTYYLHVRTDCGSGTFSTWTTIPFTTTIPNDNASGAIMLTVNGGCGAGLPYTNVGATQSATEPFTSCVGTAGYKTVWYKFVAPTSGAVRVSTDYNGAGLGDSRMAVYAATDSSDYATFTILNCDDDNGVITGSKNIEFLNGLTAGTTYYVVVDGYSASTTAGNFCLTVDDIAPSMLAASGSCVSAQGITSAAAYNGWTSLVDANGNIVANVRRAAATSDVTYDGSVTINPVANPLRNDGVTPLNYLDRNYFINSASTITGGEIAFFFTQDELDSLGTALGSLNATRQTGTTCEADFDATNGTESVLTQTSSSSANGVATMNVSTPGFSNYYLHGDVNGLNVPLVITMGDISATNIGTRNRVDWNTLSEEAGDKFEIERSADSRTFTKVGALNAVGNANTYSFFDEQPISGINYYRLRLLDKAGKSVYSKVVNATVKGRTGFAVTASPNPISGSSVTVEVTGTMAADASIVVTDVTGKVVRKVAATSANTVIDMNNLSAGMYLIRYTDKNHTESVKVTKQ